MTSDQLFHNTASTNQENFPQALYDGLMKGLGFAPGQDKATVPTVTDSQPPKSAPATADLSHEKIPLPPPRPPELKNSEQTQISRADRTLHAIAAADGSTMAGPSKDAQTAVKQFLAEKDHASAKDKPGLLKKYAPAFDRAITEADTTYAKVENSSMAAIKAAKEGYIEKNSAYFDSYKLAGKMGGELPPKQAEMARHLLDQIGLYGKLMPPEKDLKQVFGDQPDFLKQLKEVAVNQKELMGAQDSLEQATKPLLDAALEQDRTRLAFERAAQSVGNKSMAKSIDAERGLLAEQTKALTETPTELRRVYRI